MPSLLALGPGNITGVDLSANSFWRVTLSALQTGSTINMVLSLIYPPVAGQHPDFSRIALARCQVPFAETVEAVTRVANTAMGGESFELDRIRLEEGFNLFKNGGRIKEELMLAVIEDAKSLLRTYWNIREWVENGCKDEQKWKVCDAVIIARP